MKTILFVRQTAIYNDSRALKTIRTLSKEFRVLVLGWDRDGLARANTEKLFDGERVQCLFYEKRLKHGSGLKGIFKLLGFIRWTKRQFMRHRKEISFVHACDLDGALGVYKPAKKNKIPFIYDIYDYYIESHRVPKLVRNIVEKREIGIIEFADCVLICTEQRIKQIAKASPRKAVVIHNSPQLKEYDIEDHVFAKEGKIRIVYCGVLSEGRLLKEIAEKIAGNGKFELTVGGVGPLEDFMREIGGRCANITYLGSLPYDTVLALESEADLLFATYDPSIPNHKFSAPNKFYEALALGKPIVVCDGTGVDELVRQFNVGETIGYSADAFIEASERLFADRGKLKDLAINARRLYREEFSWEIMERRLLDLYADIG